MVTLPRGVEWSKHLEPCQVDAIPITGTPLAKRARVGLVPDPRGVYMTLGIARPMVTPLPSRPLTPPSPTSSVPTSVGEDPARIRATIARAPLFAALPISAIEDLTTRVTIRKVPVGSAVVAQDEPG